MRFVLGCLHLFLFLLFLPNGFVGINQMFLESVMTNRWLDDDYSCFNHTEPKAGGRVISSFPFASRSPFLAVPREILLSG